MTEPFEPVPDVSIEDLRAVMEESENNERQRMELGARLAGIKGIKGPLLDLLLAVDAQYQDYALASDAGVVTDAEARRMEAIANAAVECETWLRGDR